MCANVTSQGKLVALISQLPRAVVVNLLISLSALFCCVRALFELLIDVFDVGCPSATTDQLVTLVIRAANLIEQSLKVASHLVQVEIVNHYLFRPLASVFGDR